MQQIARREVKTLESYYDAPPDKPADWKDKFFALVREDLISATLVKHTPPSRLEGDVLSTVEIRVQYKNPVVAGERSGKLHIVVMHTRMGKETPSWNLRRYYLFEKPPM